MDEFQVRFGRLSPASNLTLLTLVQAIALERLVEQAVFVASSPIDSVELTTCAFAAVTVFAGIIVMWLAYSQLVSVLDWVRSLSQTLIPFAVGLVQFTTIALLEPGSLRLAMLIYAMAAFGGAVGLAHTFRYYRVTPFNTTFLDRFPRKLVVLLNVLLGVLCLLAGVAGDPGATTFTGVVAATALTNTILVVVWSLSSWRMMRGANSPSAA